MIISSTTGIVLDLFVSRYEGFALLAVVISGLPGAVGSIFISRLSTALHAAALPATGYRSANEEAPRSKEASPLLVMITLMIITLPVEVIFLSMLRALGWLKLPFVFVASSVLFFCCAVSCIMFPVYALTNAPLGLFLAHHCKIPDQLFVVEKTGPRHVCVAYTFCSYGFSGAESAGALFRDCIVAWRSSRSQSTYWIAYTLI